MDHQEDEDFSLADNEAATNLASFRANRVSPTSMKLSTHSYVKNEMDAVTEYDESGLTSRRTARQHRKLNSSRWTPEEDDRLKFLVDKFGPKSWHLVSKNMCIDEDPDGFGHHTAVQCMCRFKNVLDVCVRKGPWTEEEDDVLRDLVEAAQGPAKIKWREVAEHLSGRLGKQCRERWFNQLDPSINMGPWTTEEDQALLEAQHKFGNRWNRIAKMLQGRTENAVKNRFNSVSFRKWKDAVEGCLELDSSSLDSSPKLQPLQSLSQLCVFHGNRGVSPITNSLGTSIVSSSPPSFSLSIFQDKDNSELSSLQRKRFRYENTGSQYANLSTLSQMSPMSLVELKPTCHQRIQTDEDDSGDTENSSDSDQINKKVSPISEIATDESVLEVSSLEIEMGLKEVTDKLSLQELERKLDIVQYQRKELKLCEEKIKKQISCLHSIAKPRAVPDKGQPQKKASTFT